MRKIIILSLPFAYGAVGCATQYAPEHMGDPYGFFSGVLQGFLAPFALMGKLLSWCMSLFGVLFLDSVTIFGWVLGLGMGGGGAGASANR